MVTLHRPDNVDQKSNLKKFIDNIIKYSLGLKVVFPMHPRTENNFNQLDINYKSLIKTGPLSYLEFNYLVSNSKAVITDSGGITEETTVLGVPCLTLRDNTERPETITIGTNELIGTDPSKIEKPLKKIIDGNWKKGGIPKYWDGKAAKRIVNHIYDIFAKK